MKNLIIPEALRIIQSKIKIKSNELIPAFDPVNCNVENIIKVNSSYLSNSTNADFVLFLGVTYSILNPFLAFAGFCVIGKSSFLTKIINFLICFLSN